ncbi:MAG: type II CAAX endopeptidase family protein [Terracidiphilus sp.]|jgi:membrane protease YdiL (CAAX protease family)
MHSADPETRPPLPEAPPAGTGSFEVRPETPAFEAREVHDLYWVLAGSQGLRAGWSLAIFAVLYRLFSGVVGLVVSGLVPTISEFEFSPRFALIGEMIPLLALVGALAVLAQVEHRKILNYNLAGPRPAASFFEGAAAGFAALSVLVGVLALGGWLHFGAVGLSGKRIMLYAAAWGAVFLLVGLFEEGTFRCYLQFTLTRGVNFWWALAIVAALCLDLLLRAMGNPAGILGALWLRVMPGSGGNGVYGVYAVALLGLVPCLMLYLKEAQGAGFWQAAWVTSTFFGYIHTSNSGENWIGIFSAAFIGFVFCVSVRVTGSAWWAIGCHTAWDWAETYFYGTADSGIQARGHFLSTSPAGNTLWSGGADGPEGSLLVLAAIMLLLAALLAIHGRRRSGARSIRSFIADGWESTNPHRPRS